MLRQRLAAALVLAVAGYTQHTALPRAPDYALRTPEGRAINLADYAGKVVVLAFISTDCPHCREMCKLMQRLQDEYGSLGFQALAVAFDENAPKQVRDFVRRSGVRFPVGVDSPYAMARFARRLGGRVMVPVVFFIDRAGYLRGEFHGADQFLAPAVKEANVRQLVAGLFRESAGKSRGLRF